MLEIAMHVPDGVREGAEVVVLLHGRGSDEQDLLALHPHFAAGTVVVAPRAPFPGAPWGYGPGWAWYRYLGGTTPEPESYEQSQRALLELVEGLPDLLPVAPGRVTLGGFSQGGTMSLGFALRNPGVVPRVLNFSGFLPDHPTVRASAESVRGTRFFWGHGVQDPAIPHEYARAGRAELVAAGADLEARDYPIGHWIAPEELRDALGWMAG